MKNTGYLIHRENRINSYRVDLQVGHSYVASGGRPSKAYYFKYSIEKPKIFDFAHHYVYPNFNLDGDEDLHSDFVKAKLFLIEDIGNQSITDDKFKYTNGIKVIEEIDISDYIKYDQDGNVVFTKEYDSYDGQWYRFYFKYNNGQMIEVERQSMSNKKYYTEVHYKYFYDYRGNLIEIQEWDGKKFVMSEMGIYDSQNRLTEYKNKNGGYFKKTFDMDGKLIYILDGGIEIKRV